MKKVYSKPDVLIEDFSLLENISTSMCNQITHNHYQSNCHYDISGDIDPDDLEHIGITDPTHVFYSSACTGGIIGGDNTIDCLNSFMCVFSS